MKIFGRNIFGFRFASALSFLIIAAMMFLLLYTEVGVGAALMGTAAFIVSPTNWVHCFRTGDPDAVFMMFCFAAFVLQWYSLRRKLLLPFAAFCLGMAFLAKSFHVGVPGVIALVLVVFYWKRYSWRVLLAAAVAGTLPVLIWAALRFRADGWTFFWNMIERDLLGRLEGGHVSEHGYVPWYDHLSTLNHYLIVIPLAIAAASVAIGFLCRGKRCFSGAPMVLGIWAAVNLVFPVTVFSCCRVKLPWYVFPCLVYLPVMLGIGFDFALRWFRDAVNEKKMAFFVILPLLIPVADIVWLGIGEGKTIRNIVTEEKHNDILIVDDGGAACRGATLYCIAPDGRPSMPSQCIVLAIRFLDASVVLKGIDVYKSAADDALLLCTFDEEDPKSPQLAKRMAEKNSLRLVRYFEGMALFCKRKSAD